MILIFTENALLVNQGSKIPVLLSHFLEHKDKNATLSFFEFLKMHYGDSVPEDHDDQRDRELPFKKFGTVSNTIVQVSVSAELITGTCFERTSSFGITDTSLRTNFLLNSLFRPPRTGCA